MVCSLLVRKVIVALTLLVGFQPWLVVMSAGRLLPGLYESVERATLVGGVDWLGSKCLWREKLSLLHSAVLDCGAELREQITLYSAQPGVQGGPGSCLHPYLMAGGHLP